MKLKKRTVLLMVVMMCVAQFTLGFCGTYWEYNGEDVIEGLKVDPGFAEPLMTWFRIQPNAEYAKKAVDTGNMPAEYVQELKDMGLIDENYGTSPAPKKSVESAPTPVEQGKEAPKQVLESFTIEPYEATMWAINTANVRQGAAKDFPKIGSVGKDQEVKVTGKCKETSWYQITYDGVAGFVSNTLLTTQKPSTEQAVEVASSEVQTTVEPTTEVVTETETTTEAESETVEQSEPTSQSKAITEPITEPTSEVATETLAETNKQTGSLPIVPIVCVVLVLGGVIVGVVVIKKGSKKS